MRARWTMAFALAAIGVLIALPASADQHLDPADRVLVHGYDPDAMQLLWAQMMGDSETVADECNISEGEYAYEVDEEGNVSITPTVEEGEDEADPVDLGDCTFNQTDVEGPEGQVNHGTVVSNFVQDLKEHLAETDYEGGIGCFVRVIAQSDYGKGEEQVKTSDVDEDADPINKDEGQVELTVSETTCNGNGNGNGNSEGNASASGRPDHAGPPEHAGPPSHAKNKSESNSQGGPPDHAKGPNK